MSAAKQPLGAGLAPSPQPNAATSRQKSAKQLQRVLLPYPVRWNPAKLPPAHPLRLSAARLRVAGMGG